MEEDHYMILGLSQSATAEEIAKAYKRMALIYHPDKNSHPRTEEYFKKIRAAFDVLSDSESRAQYDRSLRSTSTLGSSDRRPAGTHPRQQTDQVGSPDLFPTLCAVGGVLVGLFMGYGAVRAFNGSNSGNK
ncbi:chaperone protein DnaJ-like [Drosophila elegans]|uniref:chaperone protein DnaJ-like n=1 Tax=Drosophila elegans TaxID=30023 RepID=UPI0007E884CB|nr:chaperone protein DnaJ-like [Drosophila elegans]XP_017116114.1 chaperone protein DnaJ-like [Drosophila elegans]